MRTRLQHWLNSIWYQQQPAPLWLRALSGVYAGLSALDRSLFRSGVKRAVRLPVPVIVVGNLTAGGSGKTPTVIALVESLKSRGYQPGVVSRGYGGTYREAWHRVGAHDDPAELGDETVLIARRTGVPVVVARRRALGAAQLLQLGCNVVVSDDGLQHLGLARDVEILVVHGRRRFGNGRLLPAGPLRERPDKRNDRLTLINGAAAAGELALHSALGDPRRLADGEIRPLRDWSGQRVHALAGIADPDGFFRALRAAGLDLVEHAFADHHAYSSADLASLDDGLPVLCTEKDAVKLRALAPASTWSVPLESALPQALLDEVLRRIGAPRALK